MTDAFDKIAQAATQDADERDKRMLQLQIVLRMAMDGLSYGLMLLVLEVQVDNDCVEMRALLPVSQAATWAFVIIGVTCVAFGMLLLVTVCGFIAKPGPCMRILGKCFVAFSLILMVVSILAYVYSIVLAFYLAYQVPSDSAVILGCLLAALSILSTATELWKPERTMPICDPCSDFRSPDDSGGDPYADEEPDLYE